MNAAIARLDVRTAEARVGQRRADLLPTISGNAAITRQTLNLDEFGIPIATGVTDPFDIYRLQLRGARRPSSTRRSSAGCARPGTPPSRPASTPRRPARSPAPPPASPTSGRSARARRCGAREADSTIAAQLLDQARQLVGAGVSPAIDATRSEVSFASVRTQLEVARNAADRTQLDLLRALDLPSGTRIELADSLGPGPLDLPLEPDSGGELRPRAPVRAGGRAGPHSGGPPVARRHSRRVPAEPGPERAVPADRAAHQRPGRAATPCSCSSPCRSSTASGGRTG